MEWNCFPISMIVGDDGHLWQCSSAHIGGGAGHEPLVTLLLAMKNLFWAQSNQGVIVMMMMTWAQIQDVYLPYSQN